MSHLTDLIRQARTENPELGAALEREITKLTQRRTFGLVFEAHQPEAVELPQRTVRRGDKVRVLPPRGETPKGDQTLWHVDRIERTNDGRQAHLTVVGGDDTRQVPCEDLVVVSEFADPMYPGLTETGRVEQGGDKPFHTVINAENFHALEMLTYTHRHTVDCIYIDPPYNTGAKDWKYNNDYVESDDDYRHSKWLSFMERRLQVARELLNPEDSVLIVTIDENEYARLNLLIEQTFPGASVTTTTVAINPKGTPENGFSRVDEYLIFVMLGSAMPVRVQDPLAGPEPKLGEVKVRWRGLTRTGANGVRSKSPGAYYPIFIRKSDGSIYGAGQVPPVDDDGFSVEPPEGTVAVWPTPRPSGAHGRWSVVRETFDELLAQGAVKCGRVNLDKGEFPLFYLTEPQLAQIDSGDIVITGRDSHGSLIVEYADAARKKSAPRTMWNRVAHSASEHGTVLLSKFIPGIAFDFAKSVYSVEDSLRLFTLNKPNAVVLDFFAGSGTTAHAVMRLNKQDGGRRQCISVTNNEVSADEQKGLRAKGLRPGDPEWEQWGICDYITKPRVTAAITGRTPVGDPIKGEYKFTDEFPMADGFEENAAFFTLTYEDPRFVSLHRAFARIAPMLWMRAGSEGRIIEDLGESGWDVSEVYAVAHEPVDPTAFLEAVEAAEGVRTVFIVTDSNGVFEATAQQLPDHVTPVRLYESYLHNFTINRGA
ncbi:site-specific DNA-methyltransferase [Micrococcus luteus]|uniref:site-specific DNA-methyltransferase n=1 Tax=Micrococcus luteus TaxID=1270 RepID=UPI00399F2C3B